MVTMSSRLWVKPLARRVAILDRREHGAEEQRGRRPDIDARGPISLRWRDRLGSRLILLDRANEPSSTKPSAPLTVERRRPFGARRRA